MNKRKKNISKFWLPSSIILAVFLVMSQFVNCASPLDELPQENSSKDLGCLEADNEDCASNPLDENPPLSININLAQNTKIGLFPSVNNQPVPEPYYYSIEVGGACNSGDLGPDHLITWELQFFSTPNSQNPGISEASSQKLSTDCNISIDQFSTLCEKGIYNINIPLVFCKKNTSNIPEMHSLYYYSSYYGWNDFLTSSGKNDTYILKIILNSISESGSKVPIITKEEFLTTWQAPAP